MAVKLRLKRMGRKGRPHYRLHAVDGRVARDGRSIEELGSYDPLQKDAMQRAILKKDRIEHWLRVGAQPSPTVASILKRHGIGVRKTGGGPATRAAGG